MFAFLWDIEREWWNMYASLNMWRHTMNKIEKFSCTIVYTHFHTTGTMNKNFHTSIDRYECLAPGSNNKVLSADTKLEHWLSSTYPRQRASQPVASQRSPPASRPRPDSSRSSWWRFATAGWWPPTEWPKCCQSPWWRLAYRTAPPAASSPTTDRSWYSRPHRPVRDPWQCRAWRTATSCWENPPRSAR